MHLRQKKDGFIHIANIFEETSNNEKEHAKLWFKLLSGIDNTETNLESSIKNEGYEAREMYPSFAKTAREEGFDDIAKIFEEVAEIEAQHEKRYKQLLANLLNNKVFNSDKNVKWHCCNCGYVHNSKTAPQICPACKHPQEYFEQLCENY